ncbi:FAD-dependent monooxygenase [Ancylobacter defluvii]|uniref:Oxygenase n=1 Tax=Ancylobacter defluvii TaxID=1282440 RepID=A0A9W6JZP3_9HYPH|nr:FAD-dependent monooxygenase [Ancylobacter defluvii]MBS7587048.1 FAD-dependent monooxygenase [Ancylobacter defluvii]GLK85458.1 oxygenase [Ancylobacter defluvii]
MTAKPAIPVLISGAGPTGLSLAITLRLHGIPVRIVDVNPAPAAVSKALAIWSASLEALDTMGVVHQFETEGVRLKSLIAGDGTHRLASLAVGDGIDSPYPYPLLIPQSRTEAILAARLAALGGVIERGVELVGFSQDATGVDAVLKFAGGAEETVRAQYLVGADGARSFVRRTLGIAFEGYTEPQMFLLGDVKIDGGALERQSIYIWWHNGGTVALFPFEDDVWRIFTARPSAEDDSTPTLEELQGYMDRHGPPGTRLRDPSWLSAFRTNERLAEKYRVDRIFLAGDAAHIHSPAGGQGMNTGMQDAVNLGWKLAYALAGKGDAGLLLASYEAERRPIAREVIKGAARKLHAAFTSSRVAQLVRDIAVTIVGKLGAAQKQLQLELSETNIFYEDGPLVALGAPPHRPTRTDVGTRARDADFIDPQTGRSITLWPLLCGTHHTLLLFPETAPITVEPLLAGLDGAVKVVNVDPESDPRKQVRERYRMSRPGWVLVRPDHVIAARGGADDLFPLATYVERVIRSAPVR